MRPNYFLNLAKFVFFFQTLKNALAATSYILIKTYTTHGMTTFQTEMMNFRDSGELGD